MGEQTIAFFRTLGSSHEPLLEGVSGTVRFDLDGGRQSESWFLDIRRGDVEVSRGAGRADCVIRADQDLFDRIVAGSANAYSAWLKNDLVVEGELQLLASIAKVFPGPSDARDPRPSGRSGGEVP
ncbi:SCP2 sterol-binding domain-containing protein [Micromonospora sp. WMMD1082]|uniref:SCP2 sterol-binding domain-containing protein n=1 Tax=Micromonospora sp. WMMD1082 TaxID=3016104 RepID=UPI0024178881|nr:SCP2 sterol-binding domain-containing protein [Micromonospora sp. WMMD1082]MDG4795707.1 SCP2 sterol-binding domain-containing protein [Micromonospora sp. WMMD1082]